MLKHARIKLSTLIIAVVVFGVLFSTVGATLLFGVFYQRTMFNSAYVASKQSVSQTNATVSAMRLTAATVCNRLKTQSRPRRGSRTIYIA